MHVIRGVNCILSIYISIKYRISVPLLKNDDSWVYNILMCVQLYAYLNWIEGLLQIITSQRECCVYFFLCVMLEFSGCRMWNLRQIRGIAYPITRDGRIINKEYEYRGNDGNVRIIAVKVSTSEGVINVYFIQHIDIRYIWYSVLSGMMQLWFWNKLQCSA